MCLCHSLGMSEDTPFTPTTIKRISHYHGDAVRILFVIAAGLIFLAEMLDADLPFSTFSTVVLVIVLVVAAGITNPAQVWIHWVNMVLSIFGLLLFGGISLTRFRENAPFDESFIVGCVALVFLVSLYLATRTIRGILMRGKTFEEA